MRKWKRRCRDFRSVTGAVRRNPQPEGAGADRAAAPQLDGRRLELLGRAQANGSERGRGDASASCRRPARSATTPPGGSLPRRRAGRPPGGDHRADRPQDDDQRAELRREGLAGRPRGRQHAARGRTSSAVSSTCLTPSTGEHRLQHPDGKDYGSSRRRAGRRSSSGRAAGTCRRSTSLVDGARDAGSLVDFALYFCPPARSCSSTAGSGPYFYLPKMESHLEARLWNDVFVLAQDVARDPARHHPGDRADRDLPGRVRDGGDPLRAARALRRAERRPLGLHVQRHQDVPHPRARVRAARPQRRHDDGAVHAGLHRAAGAHLPQARRARDRRDGGVHPEPATRRSTSRRSPRSRRTRPARPATASTAPGWRTRAWSRPAARSFDAVLGDRPEPARPAARGRVGHRRPSCSTSRPRRAQVTEAGLRSNISVAHAVPRAAGSRGTARSPSTT